MNVLPFVPGTYLCVFLTLLLLLLLQLAFVFRNDLLSIWCVRFACATVLTPRAYEV